MPFGLLVWLFSTCPPVDLSTCLPGLENFHLSTCQPVYQGCKTRDKYMRSRHYGYSVLVYLSTCLPGLTGAEVNIGEQWLIGIPYLSTLRPVNLSTRVDRPRGKYRRARDYGYSVLVHLSTCLPGLTGPEENIGEQGIMGILYLFTCRPVYLD